MSDIDFVFDMLYNYYGVGTIRDLSKKIGTSESTISKWKQRKSIKAIKKKCHELGIYNQIFGDQNIQKIHDVTGGQVAQNVGGDQKNINPKPKKADINIDDATYSLFLESYQKAQETNDLKGLRLYLMEY